MEVKGGEGFALGKIFGMLKAQIIKNRGWIKKDLKTPIWVIFPKKPQKLPTCVLSRSWEGGSTTGGACYEFEIRPNSGLSLIINVWNIMINYKLNVECIHQIWSFWIIKFHNRLHLSKVSRSTNKSVRNFWIYQNKPIEVIAILSVWFN